MQLGSGRFLSGYLPWKVQIAGVCSSLSAAGIRLGNAKQSDGYSTVFSVFIVKLAPSPKEKSHAR